MSSPRFRLFAGLMLCLPLAACLSNTRWEPVPEPVSPRDYIEQESPDRVRVLLTNGAEAELRGPTIRNDSIVGLDANYGVNAAFALADVRALAASRVSATGVAGNVALGWFIWGPLILMAIALTVAAAGS